MGKGKAAISPKPRGRPALPADEGKRFPLSLRTTKELKEQLDAAQRESGRSLAQEVEFRLERSFEREAARGGPEYDALFQMMAGGARTVELRLRKSPFRDPEAAAALRIAWHRIINRTLADPADADSFAELGVLLDAGPPQMPAPANGGMLPTAEEWAAHNEAVAQYHRRVHEGWRRTNQIIATGAEAAQDALAFPKHKGGAR